MATIVHDSFLPLPVILFSPAPPTPSSSESSLPSPSTLGSSGSGGGSGGNGGGGGGAGEGGVSGAGDSSALSASAAFHQGASSSAYSHALAAPDLLHRSSLHSLTNGGVGDVGVGGGAAHESGVGGNEAGSENVERVINAMTLPGDVDHPSYHQTNLQVQQMQQQLQHQHLQHEIAPPGQHVGSSSLAYQQPLPGHPSQQLQHHYLPHPSLLQRAADETLQKVADDVEDSPADRDAFPSQPQQHQHSYQAQHYSSLKEELLMKTEQSSTHSPIDNYQTTPSQQQPQHQYQQPSSRPVCLEALLTNPGE